MTKHRRRKQDARKRMAATGTRYAQASREDAQERIEIPAVSNPILYEWGQAIKARRLTMEELLEGWTLDGADASPRAKGETYLEMKGLEILWHASSTAWATLALSPTWREELLASWRRGESYGLLNGHLYPGPLEVALYASGSQRQKDNAFFAAATDVRSALIPLAILRSPEGSWITMPEPWLDFDEQLRITLASGLISKKLARKVERVRSFIDNTSDELTVWELGEEGDCWFIQGAEDEQEAGALLETWLVSTGRSTGANPITESAYHSLAGITFTERYDWFWKPLASNALDGEAELLSLAKAPRRYRGEKLMSGFFAQAEASF